MVWPGEKKAWDILSALDSQAVECNAKVLFNSDSSTYELICLGQTIFISLTDRDIFSYSYSGKLLVNELAGYSKLSILRYLIHAVDLPLSGKLVRPADLPGGDIFTRGTHVLPLNRIASHYSANPNDFSRIGKSLGASQSDYGDMSLELFPFPRIPIVLIVWAGDEEFSANSSLLFDSSCKSQLSTDIVWSTAMMAVEILLLNT